MALISGFWRSFAGHTSTHVEEEKVNYDYFLNLPEIDRSKLERIDIRTSQLISIGNQHPVAIQLGQQFDIRRFATAGAGAGVFKQRAEPALDPVHDRRQRPRPGVGQLAV
jgi:hypothetical protein